MKCPDRFKFQSLWNVLSSDRQTQQKVFRLANHSSFKVKLTSQDNLTENLPLIELKQAEKLFAPIKIAINTKLGKKLNGSKTLSIIVVPHGIHNNFDKTPC